MKNKGFPRVLILFLVLTVLVPSVFAYMIHKSQTVENAFIPGKVDCVINEIFENNIKSEIKVENTGNVKAYIRVRLVFNWVDSAGTVVARSLGTMPGVSWDTINWIRDEADNTYYYKYPVEVGKETGDLLTAGCTMNAVSEDTDGLTYYYYPVMEVLAEAIQADGKIGDEPAVTDAWGVTIDANGYIDGCVPETP